MTPDATGAATGNISTLGRRPAGILLGTIVVAIVLALAAAGYRANRDEPQEFLQTSDPGLVHIHGMAVDPSDGRLYAATHTGLFGVVTLTRFGGHLILA